MRQAHHQSALCRRCSALLNACFFAVSCIQQPLAARCHAPVLAKHAARVPCICTLSLCSRQERPRDHFCINLQVSGTVEKDGVPIKGLKLKG